MKNPFTLHLGLGLIFALFLGLTTQVFGQEKASPPAHAEGEINGANIAIHYHGPAVKGRTIWGDLVPYGKVWRAGANDATTFETDQEIKIEGETLPAGKYSFFIIPYEEESVFIFNKVHKQWGAYEHDEKQDVLRVTVPFEETESMEERLAYEVTSDGFEIRWANGKSKATIE